MRRRAMTLVLGGLLLSAPAYAQGHQPGQRSESPGGMMQMPGMQEMMMPGPAMLLRFREPLGLTDAQVARIEAIQQREQQEHHPHMQAAMAATQEADSLLNDPAPDLSRYEAKLREAANHHVQGHLAMARAWMEAREVLTPEQRSNFEFGAKVMQQGMREQMRGMMGERRPQATPARH